MQIYNRISLVKQNSRKILMTKNLAFPDKTVETTLLATKLENGNRKNKTNI